MSHNTSSTRTCSAKCTTISIFYIRATCPECVEDICNGDFPVKRIVMRNTTSNTVNSQPQAKWMPWIWDINGPFAERMQAALDQARSDGSAIREERTLSSNDATYYLVDWEDSTFTGPVTQHYDVVQPE